MKEKSVSRPRLLVTGATGKLGPYLLDEARARGWLVEGWGRAEGADRRMDLLDGVRTHLDDARPDVVIHTAAMSGVAECYRDPARSQRTNVEVPTALAEWCSASGAQLVHLSTDMVFDGEGAPYSESSPVCPITVYGRSKAAAETAVLEACPSTLVARMALMCGPSRSHRRSFFDGVPESLRRGETVHAFADEWRSPLYLGDAAAILCDLAKQRASGVVHVAGPERLSRWEMCRRLADRLGVPANLVQGVTRAEEPADEPRQRDLSMRSQRLSNVHPGPFDRWL